MVLFEFMENKHMYKSSNANLRASTSMPRFSKTGSMTADDKLFMLG